MTGAGKDCSFGSLFSLRSYDKSVGCGFFRGDEADSIAKAKINPVLMDAGTDTFHVREITLLHPMDCCRHLDHSGDIQVIELFGIRAAPLRIKVLSNLCHITYMGAYMLPSAISDLSLYIA